MRSAIFVTYGSVLRNHCSGVLRRKKIGVGFVVLPVKNHLRSLANHSRLAIHHAEIQNNKSKPADC